jgi:putative DNA methylase
MSVRSALARINEILDQVLAEQEGDFDAATRFAIAWYRQHGYQTGSFGDADNLARARNTAVQSMAHAGILTSLAGKVTLLAPDKLSDDYNVQNDDNVGIWEILHHLIRLLNSDGIPAAGALLAQAGEIPGLDTELIKELAFMLFAIAERGSASKDALAFNSIATSWPDIVQAARDAHSSASGTQAQLELDEA